MADYDNALKKALRQAEGKGATLQWMRERTAVVKDNISAHDVLRHQGIALKYPGSGHEEQMSCPFHGRDNKPSARVYPEGARSKSHVYCYTCGKTWDVFGLWKAFRGADEMRFSQVVFELEKAFGIIPPEGPSYKEEDIDEGPSDDEREVLNLFELCESRLLETRPNFEKKGYLQIGQVLDKLRFRFDNRSVTATEARSVLHQVQAKILEKT